MSLVVVGLQLTSLLGPGPRAKKMGWSVDFNGLLADIMDPEQVGVCNHAPWCSCVQSCIFVCVCVIVSVCLSVCVVLCSVCSVWCTCVW